MSGYITEEEHQEVLDMLEEHQRMLVAQGEITAKLVEVVPQIGPAVIEGFETSCNALQGQIEAVSAVCVQLAAELVALGRNPSQVRSSVESARSILRKDISPDAHAVISGILGSLKEL